MASVQVVVLAFLFSRTCFYLRRRRDIIDHGTAASCVLGLPINVTTGRISRRRGRLFSWTYRSLDGYCPCLKISNYFTMGVFLGLIYPISETLITIGRGD